MSDANTLLQVALRCFAAAAASGSHAIVEHPADWFDEHEPSIFRLPEVLWLKTWPRCRFEVFDKCCAGAPHKKPTKLLVAGLPSLRAAKLPHHGRCPGKPWHVHAALQGTAEDGSWKTTPAKEYPAEMCAWIARAIADAAPAAPAQLAEEPVDPRWQPFLVGLDAAAEVPPDFHGERLSQ